MKIAIEFPSVVYREGPQAVATLGRSIERIGCDQLDLFDHVVMAHPTEGRTLRYPAKMPILEPLVTLSFLAAAPSRQRRRPGLLRRHPARHRRCRIAARLRLRLGDD